ncbi:dTDP-4-dehydrorhamnose reductase [Yoonia sp. R2331]|uniref:dTDP-4-dehydrorhamnose reductase n=1 Tax=Yoonia sp. R2331 TaxID=3237238 RepID=UPI0034E422E6
MSVLVFGRSGQVALALGRLGADCVGRETLDLAEPDPIAELIAARAPNAVINAAAYTAVDRAEEDEALATAINATAPGHMAAACAARDVPFLHISTDYVFDGSGHAPWAPDAATGPLGAYGRSKLAGEVAVRAAGGRAVILRTAAVFSADGANFVKTMLRLGATRDALNVVADQVTGPTPADAIAAACLEIAAQLDDARKVGTYHFSGQPSTSWADFARAVFAASGQRVTVTDIPSSAYPTPAKRPSNSRLDCATLTDTFGIRPPAWKPALARVVAEVMEADA